MKRKLALILTLFVVVFAFASCVESENKPVRNNVETKQNQEEESKTESEVESETIRELSRGQITGSIYENGFIGIGFELPEGWVFETDEGIEQLFGYTAGIMSDEVGTIMDENGAFCDMYASGGFDNVNIIIEKKNDIVAAMDFEDVADNSFELMKNELSNIYDSVDAEKVTVSIDGKNYPGHNVVGQYMEITLYQRGFMIDLDEYIATFTVTSLDETGLDNICDQIYHIK